MHSIKICGIFCRRETEIGALFHSCKVAHIQEPIQIKTDNATASAFCNSTLKQKRSKTWNMRWYWLKDRVKQGHIIIYWDKSSNNLVDYHTKYFPQSYHTNIHPKYILKGFT